MSNVDPQSAAEFIALEKLRLAVLQYREEVGQLLQKRGLASTASVPLVDLEELPPEFALLAQTAMSDLSRAPIRVEAPRPAAPPPVVVPPVVAPVVAPPAPVAPPIVVTPKAMPSPPLVPLVAPLVSPASKPQLIAATIPQDEPDEFTGATQDIRVKTSPFAPLTPSQPIPQVRPELNLPARPELGLPTRPEPLMRSAPELIAEIKTPLPLSAEAQATPRINLPSASPSAMMRRPGMSPSMQIETVGSFLRRFRLASE
jgi:hypothetical protein